MAQKTPITPKAKTRNEAKWWGAKDREKGRHSVLELVKKGTIDIETTAVLWLLMERKGSVVIASETPETGRTTLLSALLDLLPPSYTPIYLYGKDPDLAELKESDPESSYVLAPELGPDAAAHIWGKHVSSIFKTLDKGYSLATTVRADSPEEVFHLLQSKPVSLSEKLCNNIHAVVNMRLAQGVRVIHRRVCQVTVTGPVNGSKDYRMVTLVGWEPDSDSHMHMRSPETRSALAGRLNMDEDAMEEEITARRRRLKAWYDMGITSTNDLAKALDKYYNSRE
ncbi:MAG: hypothetical protein O2854_01475 [Chloroflexi bacterium]|nr:hypothetical protein [Chloroflexota bacterium]